MAKELALGLYCTTCSMSPHFMTSRHQRKSLLFALVWTSTFLLTSSVAAPSSYTTKHADPVPNVDWDSFGFGLNGVETDKMWLNRVPVTFVNGLPTAEYEDSAKECLVDMGTIPLSPAATVLNYGQALFEGLKAFRRQDGTIVLFRPEMNAHRMQQGARRFLMPPVPTDVFLKAAEHVVRSNARWIPPAQHGALYLRPLLLGTGAALGVKPSTESTFCIYASPVGNYFKGELKAISLQAVKGYSRAAPGGSGAVKASGNYAPAFGVQHEVRNRGFDETLCLDVSGEAVEEAGASNFFVVFPNNTIVTPTLETETILPGVTRASIMEIARNELGCKVIERRLLLSELENVSEAFCCGTGACITPVGCVSVIDGTTKTHEIVFGDGNTGQLTKKLYKMLTDIQKGCDPVLCEKYKHWIHVVEP